MLLEVNNLVKWFDRRPAEPLVVLHGIDLAVEAGDFVALIGPSGAGKTTLLNIVSTLDSPSAGKVLISGVDVNALGQRKLNHFRNRNLGFVFQDDLLLDHLTAIENVMLPGRIAQIRPRKSESLGRAVEARRARR